jgi:hypothetical protein
MTSCETWFLTHRLQVLLLIFSRLVLPRSWLLDQCYEKVGVLATGYLPQGKVLLRIYDGWLIRRELFTTFNTEDDMRSSSEEAHRTTGNSVTGNGVTGNGVTGNGVKIFCLQSSRVCNGSHSSRLLMRR